MAGSAPPTGAGGGTTFPLGSDNGTDFWDATGLTQVLTAPIAGLVANSPVQVIAGTAGKKIKVLGIVLFSSIANSTVQFQDEAGSPNKLTGVLTFPANGTIVFPPTKFGWITTLAGAALDIAITGSSNVVGGSIIYVLV